MVLVVALAGAAALYKWQEAQTPPQQYREVRVERGDISFTILSTGTVGPERQLDIKAPIAGRAEEILVEEGQSVKKGDLLAWVSSSERAALLDAAQAKGAAERNKWKEFYRPTPVMAPVSGTIIQRNVETGQTFTTADAIFVLSDRLVIKAQVDEVDIAHVKLGQRARITLDAYGDQPFEGKVSKIAFDAALVNNVTTYIVEVLPDHVPPFMRSGMTANVRFTILEKKGVLLVTSDAVSYSGETRSVLLKPARPEAQPEQRIVELGISDAKRTEILAGLEEGELLLIPEVDFSKTGAAGGSPFAPSRRR